MTNYNDGKWHRWNGEDMKPASVHNKSILEYLWHDEKTQDFGIEIRQAGRDENEEQPAWGSILKLRVIKEYREPREFWIVSQSGELPEVHGSKPKYHEGITVIHVREVLE